MIDFFVNRTLAGETLTMYQPGTQARNFVHVKDAARAYVRSAERLLEQLSNGETGTKTYKIASEEDPSVKRVGETVREVERGIDVNVELVENPRSVETMVEEFEVDISKTRSRIGWSSKRTISGSIRDLIVRDVSMTE